MKLLFEVEIEDAQIDLSNYATDDNPSGVATVAEAIEIDLEVYRGGVATLEEVLYNLGGELKIKLQGVYLDKSKIDDYRSEGEALNYDDDEDN